MSNIARVSVSALAGAVLFAGASVALAGSSANFSTGDKIVLTHKVKVRGAANGAQVGSQARGATGTLVGGPVVLGGYTWWNVDYVNGVDGWSAEDYMQSSSVALTSSSGTVAGASTSAQIEALKAQLAILLAQLQALLASRSQ